MSAAAIELDRQSGDRQSGDRVAALPSTVPGIDRVASRLRRYAFTRHTHDYVGLGVMLHGGHDSLYGSRRRVVAAGQVMVVNAGEVHDGSPLGEEGRSYILACFEPAVLGAGVADASGDPGWTGTVELAPSIEWDAAAAPLVRHALDGLAPGVDPLDRDQRLAMLYAAVAAHAGRSAAADADGLDPVVRRARERLAEALGEPLTIADLAEETGASRYALIRRFAREVGLTPHAWRMQRRIEAARRLLAAGTPPAEAAAALGFADQAHLTRLFRRQFGMTPGRYAAARGA